MAITGENSKDYLLKAIKARLLAKVPEIKTFGLWQGQTENEEAEDPFDYPACFLQFSRLVYQSQEENVQIADAMFTLHVAITSIDANDLSIFEVLNKIQDALQGFEDPEEDSHVFTTLYREGERQVLSRSNVVMWQVDYTTFLKDIFTHRIFKQVKVAPPVTLEIIKVRDSKTKPWLNPNANQ